MPIFWTEATSRKVEGLGPVTLVTDPNPVSQVLW